MFKNGKEKNNYISTEEIEKMYKFQKKSFDAKIAEQEHKIDELVDYISARFGENVANSNMATKLKNIEKNLQEMETNYKTNLEKTTKDLKKQIEKDGQKIAADLNDAQTKAYFKLLQKNESDMTKIKKLFDEKKENDERIANLDKIVKEHIKDNELYKKEMQEELKSTNQKISKVNYLGISSKFDKKIKDECEKIDNKIEEEKNLTQAHINKLGEKFQEKIGQVQENLQSNEEEVGKLREVLAIDIKEVNQKIKDSENQLSKLDSKLLEEIETITGNIQDTEDLVSDLNEKFSKKLEKISLSTKNNETAINKIDKRITKEIEKVNVTLQNSKNEVNNIEQTLAEKLEAVNINFQNNEALVNKLDEKLSKEIETSKLEMQNNKETVGALEREINQTKLMTKEAVNKLKDITKNKNIKLDEKINLIKQDLATIQKEIKTIETNLKSEDANKKIDSQLEDVIVKIEESKQEVSKIEDQVKYRLKQIKKELNEQIANNQNENKTELESIAVAVEDVRSSMEDSIDNIGAEIIRLKEEVKANLKKQDNDDIEFLKKDYNKYTTKVNNELAKISKDILNAQKKNLEQNRNLQVKIKAYIDTKLEKINSTQKIEELINNLNLSMLEREKVQKLEMEQLLNKKLKAIQKENERILNNKIEEIASKLIRENSTSIRTKPNNVTIYEETPTKKKSMYELIDNNQILKRSASSKKPLSATKEGKSQILKFFYDDEE